jgi:phage shock protein PspC (stress-responsive transcriptional regulator)
MNKVVTIHLDGIAYQLEESAYNALQAYLDDAKAKLANNPDKEEIVSDLEQAIGAKLSAHLSANKNVLTQSDIDEVLTEMGPVAAEGAIPEGSAASDIPGGEKGWGWPSHGKRLYRISEGRWIAGVCTGLAAYFDVDVTLVRILFVVATFLLHGLGGLVYIILMIFVPRARTPKEYQNASGIPPVTAQELVDRARKSVEDFANSGEWKYWQQNWKNESNKWKHQHKAWKHAQKAQWKAERYAYRHEHHSVVSEIFGIACATLAITFTLWFLYGHVGVVHDFFNALHSAYESFIYGLAGLIGNK